MAKPQRWEYPADREFLARYDEYDADKASSGLGDRFKGCVSEYFEAQMDKHWMQHKDTGNEALKEGDLDEAVKCYTNAARLAERPLYGLAVLKMEGRQWAKSCALRSLLSIDDVLRLIGQYFSKPPCVREVKFAKEAPERLRNIRQKYKEPNRPAAICYANTAAALIKQGKYKEALAAAKCSVKADPEYVKGHHREMRSHELLGSAALAKEKQEEIRDFGLLIDRYPYYMCSLMSAGWISWEDDTYLYGGLRFDIIAQWVLSQHKDGEKPILGVSCSLVPFQGTQSLMCNIRFVSSTFSIQEVKCVDFCPTDSENGDDLELPPNGIASAKSRQNAPRMIQCFIKKLSGKVSGDVTSLTLGQGLMEMQDAVSESVAGVAPNATVMPALSTHAGLQAMGL